MFSKATFGDSYWGKVRREGLETDKSKLTCSQDISVAQTT